MSDADDALTPQSVRNGYMLQKILSIVQQDGDPARMDGQAIAQHPAVIEILALFKAWIWQTDANLKFTYVSAHFQEYAQASPGVFRDATIPELLERYSADNAALSITVARLNRLMEERRPIDEILHLAGTLPQGESWYRFAGRAKYDNKLDFLGYWGIANDVSDDRRKRRQEASRIKQLAFALDALDVSVLILNRLHEIEFFNKRWERLHEPMSRDDYKEGVSFHHYLRSAIALGLFPDAIGREEDFVNERIAKNRHPPKKPFIVARQNSEHISINVSSLQDGTVAIVSTHLPTKTNQPSMYDNYEGA